MNFVTSKVLGSGVRVIKINKEGYSTELMEVNILLVFIYILDLIRHYCQSLLRDADAGKSGENLCDETMLQIL